MTTRRIDCRLRCEIPSNLNADRIPIPTDDTPGTLHCPNEGCGRVFIMTTRDDQ